MPPKAVWQARAGAIGGGLAAPGELPPLRKIFLLPKRNSWCWLSIKNKEETGRCVEEVQKLFPILRQRSRQQAGILSGGEQRMLAIGIALMQVPKLLMLDEPFLGLRKVEKVG